MLLDPRLLNDLRFAEAPGGKAVLIGYADGGGVPTNGYGHTGADVYIGQVIGQAQADNWLNNDADSATAYAVTLPEWGSLDTPCRRNAIIECVFNLGFTKWKTLFPKTRAYIQTADWINAQQALLDSPLWISQVGLGRVSRLAGYIGSGSYPDAT